MIDGRPGYKDELVVHTELETRFPRLRGLRFEGALKISDASLHIEQTGVRIQVAMIVMNA